MSEYEQGQRLYEGATPDPDVVARLQVENLVRASSGSVELMQPADGDVIWALSADGRITHVSREVEATRGFTPQEAVSQSLDQMLTPASQAISFAYFQSLLETLARGEAPLPFRGEMEYTCKDGSARTFDVQAIPHLSDAGELIELIGLSRPLTA